MVIVCRPARQTASLLRQNLQNPRRRTDRRLIKVVARNDVKVAKTSPLVTTTWLKEKLVDRSTKVLDASWYLPQHGRDPIAEFKTEHIPSAQYFDVNGISDKSSSLPHMIPSEDAFAAAADVLGIKASDHVVVYDGMGLFSAARAWWMFKIFGHQDVSVLDGGLVGWKAEGLELENLSKATDKEVTFATEAALTVKAGQTQYPAKLDRSQVKTVEEMLEVVKSGSDQIVDARPSGRFKGTTPEPRKGLKSGHMPGSLSIPHSAVLTPEGYLKSKEELMSLLKEIQFNFEQNTICSCGSGITACILALMLDHLGFEKKVAVYDGSWSEWGGREDTPVVT